MCALAVVARGNRRAPATDSVVLGLQSRFFDPCMQVRISCASLLLIRSAGHCFFCLMLCCRVYDAETTSAAGTTRTGIGVGRDTTGTTRQLVVVCCLLSGEWCTVSSCLPVGVSSRRNQVCFWVGVSMGRCVHVCASVCVNSQHVRRRAACQIRIRLV